MVPANIANIDRGRITYVSVLVIKVSEISKIANKMRARIYKDAFVAVAANKTETAEGA